MESVSKVKKDLKIINAVKFHLNEIINVLCTILRQDPPLYFLNYAFNKFVLEKLLNGEARKTELTFLEISKTISKKSLVTQMRKMFNAFAKHDIKIIEKLLTLYEQNFFTLELPIGFKTIKSIVIRVSKLTLKVMLHFVQCS